MQSRTILCGAFLCSALIGQAISQTPTQKSPADDAKERTNLTGVWKGFAVEGKGENPNRGPLQVQLTITATSIKAVNLGDNSKDMGEGTYKLDVSKPMKELDATGIVLPRKKAQPYLGIYEVEGDTLRWCVDNTNRERPTEFRTGGGKYLLVLKRVK